ncbi:hypothetical protein AB4124_01595 [Paenibacillus sp. 2KB_20]
MYIQLPWTNSICQWICRKIFLRHHLVRVVMKPINRLDDRIFVSAYPGGGRDSYHPKMLTKVIVYAYTQRIFSSDRQGRSQECYVHVDCRENLRSEEGHALSVRRMVEPESVFG